MTARGIELPSADARGILFYGKRMLRFPQGPSNPMAGTRVGDILWLRESFARTVGGAFVRASTGASAPPPGLEWRPAGEMPMQASGLTMIVRRVSTSRLFDLDHVALRDEGVFHDGGTDFLSTGAGWGHPGSDARFPTPQEAYDDYWASTRQPCGPEAMLDLYEIDAVHSDVVRLAEAFTRAA